MSDREQELQPGDEARERKERRPDSPASDFVRLLEYLRSNRGFDFSGYKLSSLIRRVQKRMQQVGCGSYSDYIDYLEVHPDEFLPLFNTVLINVTAFFRDPQAWQTLAEQVLLRIRSRPFVGEASPGKLPPLQRPAHYRSVPREVSS